MREKERERERERERNKTNLRTEGKDTIRIVKKNGLSTDLELLES